MKKLPGNSAFNISAIFSLLLLFLYVPSTAHAATPVVTGTTSTYGVLAGTTITNIGLTSIEAAGGNDVGLYPGSTFTGSGSVTMTGGNIHLNDADAQNAQLALTTAYGDVNLRGPETTIASDLGGDTLTAGVYTTADTTFVNTGTLTLDAKGNPNAMFFFKAASTLVTGDSVASQMHLINQAQACNVYWQIGASATLGSYSTFVGHLYAQVSITAKTGAHVSGQLLARTGTVTLDTNIVSNPSCHHTVTFETNAGTGGSMAAQTNNATSTLTVNGFTKTGYTFTGWNTQVGGGGTSYANSASYSFATDLTLYAQWTLVPPAMYTVTFNGNGASSGATASQTGNSTTPLTTSGFSRTGYSFSGWNTQADGAGAAHSNGASYAFLADLYLYAQWTLLPPSMYSVTFLGNGATSGATAVQTGNAPAALTPNGFARTGYTFDEWNTVAGGGGTVYDNNAAFSFLTPLTLFAQWILAPINHTVTFHGNGSLSGTTAPQTANVSTPLTVNGFIRSLYTFTGWNTQASGGGTPYANNASYSFASTLDLYAEWTLVPLPNHSVTFHGNNASSGATAAQTAKVTTPLTANGFIRNGYYFTGWDTQAGGGGSPYPNNASYAFLADLNLFAQWTRVPAAMYTVTFMGNGATGGTTAVQRGNVETFLRANGFTRPGYFFEDWNTLANLSGVDYEEGSSYSFTQDLTLYAEWSLIAPLPHTVTYNSNGATGGTPPSDASSPYTTDSTVTVLGNSGSLFKLNYTFVGWNTAANGTSNVRPPGSTFSIVIDTILYAQWIPTPIPMATLHVIKEVINDDGGRAVPSDFQIHVKYLSIEVIGSPSPGAGGGGQTYVLPAGTYLVSENSMPGYYGYFSGPGFVNGLVTLTPGSEVTITRTNNDIAAPYVPSPEPIAVPIPPTPTVTTEIGGVLPKTASPWYDQLVVGVVLTLGGAIALIASRRQRKLPS